MDFLRLSLQEPSVPAPPLQQRVLAHWLTDTGNVQKRNDKSAGWWPAEILRRGTVDEETEYGQVVYLVRYDERCVETGKQHERPVPQSRLASALAYVARNAAAAEAAQQEAEYEPPTKVQPQQRMCRAAQPEFNTLVELDLATGAIKHMSPALVFGNDPVLLAALHAVEYVNGQLIRLLGGDTRTLYTGALAYAPLRASQLGPGMCLHWFSDYLGERGIMQIKYYVMGHGHCVNVATLFKGGRQWLEVELSKMEMTHVARPARAGPRKRPRHASSGGKIS